MEIIGRITADAVVHKTKDEKTVVNFSVAVNDSYRNRDGEKITATEFYRCAYWLTDKVARYLTKGVLVQLSGRLSQNAWRDSEGEPRATLNFHIQNIRFHGSAYSKAAAASMAESAKIMEATEDDLPF